MILAIDVHYRTNFAKAVSIAFNKWNDNKARAINSIIIKDVAEYIPGQFYKRELPCILKILEKSDLQKVQAIIIDGYVTLDDDGKPGLGSYLYEALNREIPIIGVAKSSFYNNDKFVAPVLRGESMKPIYITSRGIALKKAAKLIKEMHGTFRIPTLLALMDQETKK